MNKKEYIRRYGEAAWERKLEQRWEYYKAHRTEEKARVKKYDDEHPEQVIANNKKCREEHPEEEKARSHEKCQKGGKYYDKKLEDPRTGLQGARNKIRKKHAKEYRPYKDIIAPESQIHHEWVPQTAEYRGVALVEKEAHMHGFVDVIEILEGKITLLTEEEVKNGKKNMSTDL